MKRIVKISTAVIAAVVLGTGVLAGCSNTPDPDPTPTPTPTPTQIKLDQETLSLDADRSEQLVATGAEEIVWRSENEAVATVDEDGNVTGINPGTCKIVAATEDGKYEAECTVTVTGYHLSKNVFSGFTKVENNTYNGEYNYAVNNTSEDAFIVSYDRSKMTNSWTSLVLWYDCALSPTSFDLTFEVTKGSIPCVQFEFGGESSFKQFERYAVTDGVNTISLNLTDVDLDGEGSWKAIYLELNNPCPLEGTEDTQKGETEIKFTSVQLKEGEKKAPAAPANAEVTDGVVYWDRVLAASEYELEVDGEAITDLGARTRAAGDAPVMRRAYKPTDENAFTAGEHTAKIRSKNSAGVSDWKEFSFIVEGGAGDTELKEAFVGITKHENNQYNTSANYFTATESEDAISLSFTAAAADPATWSYPEWNTYLFYFDTATISAKKLHIRLKLTEGDLEQVRFQIDRWNNETSSSEMVYGADLTFDADGYAELTIDVESAKLANSNGSVMLYLGKYAMVGQSYTIEVLDVSLYSE